jgi:DegV family protein with EDD domain
MSYKVVVDSCGELTEEMRASGNFVNVPLQLSIDGNTIVDDETFDQKAFLKAVAESSECPRSSCPSPEAYMDQYRCDAQRVYVVTLSAELSGSYNSAVLGKNLYEEEFGEKQIYVFNSRSASVGETLVALKIRECEEAGMSFEDVIRTVEEYIGSQHTYFVLESLESLRKNGRLTGMKAIVATALNIKPIMGSTPEGMISQLGQGRGIKKALRKMVDKITEETQNASEKIVAISHCNCPERAKEVLQMLTEKLKVKGSVILDTRGVSSLYANDGGIIVVL